MLGLVLPRKSAKPVLFLLPSCILVVPNVLLALYGFPGRISDIKSICEKHGALLIEDAAEAMGANENSEVVNSSSVAISQHTL